MIYSLGHPKPPDTARLAQKADAREHPRIKARLGAPLPPAADKLPPWIRIDQGAVGSCTWASSSIAIFVACEALGLPLPFIPSQREGYAATRALERARSTNDAALLPPLQDVGADLEDVWQVDEEYGVEATLNGQNYDITVDNVNNEPHFESLEEGASTLIQLNAAQHAISPSDPSRSDLMAAALDASPPVVIEACGLVDQDFMDLGPGDIAQPARPNNGGHAFAFSAYRTNAAGRREFRLENSWGLGWADAGAVWCSEDFCASLWAIYPLYPQRIASRT